MLDSPNLSPIACLKMNGFRVFDLVYNGNLSRNWMEWNPEFPIKGKK
jgi:hypothetical protein